MWDGVIVNPEDYALRTRLGQWFGQQQLARDTYTQEGIAIDPESDYSDLNKRPLRPRPGHRPQTMKIAHAKLTSGWGSLLRKPFNI